MPTHVVPVIVVTLSLGMPCGPAWAQAKAPRQEATPTHGTTSTTSVTSLTNRPVIIMFDGAAMSDARARTIARNAGFTYVSWSPCAGTAQHCAAIKVSGQHGRIYEYPVIDTSCLANKTATPTTRSPAATPASVAAASDTSANRRARHVSVKTGTLASTTSTSTGQGHGTSAEEVNGNASSCFGGYTSLHRVRIEDSYVASGSGFLSQLHHTYQLIVDRRWTDKVTELLDAWNWPVEGSGVTRRGHDYKLMDSHGVVVASSSDEVQYIASSTPAAPSLNDRCKAMVGSSQGVFSAVNQVAYDVCKVVTLPLPDVTSVSASLKPLGVGLSLGGTKNMEICVGARDTVNTVIVAASNLVMADCLANPGRYFPADYPAVTTPLEVVTDTFKSTAPEKIVLEGDCPAQTTFISQFQIGSMVCTQSTPMTCEKNSQGECECKQDGNIGAKVTTVCTDG